MVPKRDSEAVTLAHRDRLMLTADRSPGKAIIGRDGIAIVTTALLLLALAAALLIPQDQAEMLRTFTPEHIEMLGMFDSRAQQRAHRLLVVLLAMLGVAALLSRRRSVKLAVPRAVISCVDLVRDNAGIGVLAGVAICFLLYRSVQPATNYALVQGVYYPLALLPSALSQLSAMAAGALVVLAYCWAGRQTAISAWAGALKLASILALAVYALTLCVTAFAIPPDLRGFTPDGLSAVEWHYSGNLGAGDQLAAGMPLGRVPLNAGLLSAVLLASAERIAGLFSFGTHVRIVQALQVLFLGLTAAALWSWYRPRWLPALLALLLIFPWVEPLHVAMLYPNQSAWRFLGLAAAVLALVSLYQRPGTHSAAYLGFVAGLALGWNLETGACVTAAFVAFLVLRTCGRSSGLDLLRCGVLFGCGLAVAFLLLAIIIGIGLGYWPDLGAVLESFPLVGQFAGGYGGLKLTQIDPLACLIFVHALFVVVYGIVRWQHEDIDARGACRIALATLIVLWSAYYFKGPHFWNVWSLLFLYGFLLGDLLPPRPMPAAPYPMRKVLTSFGAAALALIVLPAIWFPNLLAVRAELDAVRVWANGQGCPGTMASGICLSQEQGDALQSKAQSLVSLLGAHDGAVYLTSNSYFMPLMTGVLPPLQQRDAFELTISHADFDGLVAQLARLDPPCLLFDAPGSVFAGSNFHRRFYERLRSALPAYDKQASAPAWDVRCR